MCDTVFSFSFAKKIAKSRYNVHCLASYNEFLALGKIFDHVCTSNYVVVSTRGNTWRSCCRHANYCVVFAYSPLLAAARLGCAGLSISETVGKD